MLRADSMTSRSQSPRHVGGLPVRIAGAYALLFLITLVSYSIAWPQAPVLEGDSAQYLEVAQDLRDGRLDVLHFRTVGYPLLLAVTSSFENPTRTLFHAGLLLHFASIWVLGAALHQAGAGARWLLALAILLALPPYIEPAAIVMTENLAQFGLAAGFGSLVLWRTSGHGAWIIAGGLALAFCAIVRPVYQLLSPAVAAALILWSLASWRGAGVSRRFHGAAMLLLTWLAVVGGIAMFNQVRFGWFGLAPSAGFHLSTKTIALVERLPDEYAAVREILVRARDTELIRRGGTHTGTQAIWRAQAELAQVTGLSMPELSRYLVRMNLVLIRRAPVEYLQEVARSLASYWFPASGRLAAMDSTALRLFWSGLHAALFAAFLVQLAILVAVAAIAITFRGAGAGARPLRIRITEVQSFAYTLAMTIVLYTMILSCTLDIGEPRQRRSSEAIFVAAVAIGLLVWRRTASTGADSDVPPGTISGRDRG